MPNPPGIGGPRNSTVNPNTTARTQQNGPQVTTPQAPAPAAGGWPATGAQQQQRTTGGGQPTAATTAQGPVDDQTRTLVRSTFDQLKTAQGELARLTPQLQQAQTQLVADKKAVPWGETLNPMSRGPKEQKVDQTQARITQLTGQIDGLRGRVGQLDGQINTAISNALKNDPDFKSRDSQLATLGRAQTATKNFLGQIDDTTKAIKSAISSINADSTVDGLNAVLGNKPDATSNALDASRELQKAQAMATASAKVSVLPTYAEAWQTQIQTLTNETVRAGNAGPLNAQVNTWLPLTREFVSPEFANTMGALDNMNNAAALGRAQGKVESLRDNVAAYDDQVSSRVRTLQTTQNNAVSAARTQVLQ